MGRASVITNQAALLALQALNASQRDLAAVQQKIATGLKVAGPKDNAATWGIAQAMRADLAGWKVVNDGLARAASALEMTDAAVTAINDLLLNMKSLAVAYADTSLDDASRSAIRRDLEAHIRQIDHTAREATFDGLNFIGGQGVEATVQRTVRYSLPSSTLTPQSFLTPMSSGANSGVSNVMRTTTVFDVPRSDLTPDAFSQIRNMSAVAAGTSVALDRVIIPSSGAYPMDRSNGLLWPQYATAGRVDIWVDAFSTPNTFEIWHGGRRVAASGQAYAPASGPVGPPSPLAGQVLLSFDYDPAFGREFEIVSTGGGAWAVEHNTESPPGSPVPAAPVEHSVSVISTASGTPAVNLRPETSGSSPSNMGVATFNVDGGANPGRVDLVFDAFETPDLVEIYQDGRRVAASGVPYAPGGGAVGAGTPVSGQTRLSFDYDPALGTNLEFRFNEGGGHAGAGWTVGGLELYPAGSPLMPASFATTTQQTVITTSQREAYASLGGAPYELTPESEAPATASRTYVLDGGDKSGRVDMWVDAYGRGDVVEVWQGGTRLAASGQPYAPGGGAVGPGAPQTGRFLLSFDYDHTTGLPLEFRFNEGVEATDSAWTVSGLVLQEAGSPYPPTPSASTFDVLGEVFPDIEFAKDPEGQRLLVPSRNLTAEGLLLSGVDWNNAADLLARVDQAMDRAMRAAAHFGERGSLVRAMMAHGSRLQDALAGGVGNLVDADLGKEAARLEAIQVRERLAAQTLSIANRDPQWILGLFRA